MSSPQRLAPSIDELRQFYVGKTVEDVPKPALVLDVAKARRHCQSMLDAVQALGVGFRAHVKTHKTTQLARLQVGETSSQVKIVVSTVPELQHLLPLLREFKDNGRQIDVLYGIPLPPSQATRVAEIARELGPGSITFMIDHPDQLEAVGHFFQKAGFPAGVYLKVDTGYHRAGLPPSALNKNGLLEKVMHLEAAGQITLTGLYSHSSLSYADTTAKQAMDNLAAEIKGCVDALQQNSKHFPQNKELTISVGASPQVAAVQNFAGAQAEQSSDSEHLRTTIQEVTKGELLGFRVNLELHAGVYTVLDNQQLSTHARTFLSDEEEEVAVFVAAEVCSVYNDGERKQPEALVAVGVLGLGREPCPSYTGWGIVSRKSYAKDVETKHRLVVGRISQEHSILTWDTKPEGDEANELPPVPLEVGQSVRIYPNHACVTGAMYGWYLVVDSSAESSQSKIVDVWVRASGW
ncbi:alanine racemase domain protein [Colletotrichum truncatum]|uniref:Alanine racemase domain protein n=1 Tax=Colletotrichum truncatum TaxID=5467 RepID=A0ACC3ZFK5_COLTU|nr:alanine racemase domain protein [Colletotrichum truncatum]KAF6801778.1 alanine racemase domain protein [Colletotrichum truncatum]